MRRLLPPVGLLVAAVAGIALLPWALAWDVGYPAMTPEYRTAECHDGSPLDVRPETALWP